MAIGKLVPTMHLAMNPICHCGLWSRDSFLPDGRPLPCVHPTLSALRVDKGLSEEDPAAPPAPAIPDPIPGSLPCCGLVLRFGSRREFPLDPVFSSPTSLYLNPFVSKIPFGVLCLFFFPLLHGKLLRMYKYVFSLENRFLYILGLWFLRQAGLQKWRLPRKLLSGGPSASERHSPLGPATPWQPLSFLKPRDCSLGWPDISHHILLGSVFQFGLCLLLSGDVCRL